jgi:hypothetical protein
MGLLHPLSAICAEAGTLLASAVRNSASRSAQKSAYLRLVRTWLFSIFTNSNLRTLKAPVLSCSFSCARHVVALTLVDRGSDRRLGVDDP